MLSKRFLQNIPRFVYHWYGKAMSDLGKAQIPMTMTHYTDLSDPLIDQEVSKLFKTGSTYMPTEVVNKTSITGVLKCAYVWDGIAMTVYLAEVDNKSISTKQIIDTINLFVYILNKWVIYQTKQASPQKAVKIILAPFNIPKHTSHKSFDHKKPNETALSPINVNSGFTQWGISTTPMIVVFRKEEFNKVLMHELMHFFDIDNNIDVFLSQAITKGIEGRFKLSGSPLILRESFNDTMACLFLICIDVMRHKHKSKEAFYKAFERSFLRSKKHILNVASLVLQYYGYTDVRNPKPMHQKSHIFSYYVCKAVNFLFPEDFNNIIMEHNMFTQAIGVPYAEHIKTKLEQEGFTHEVNIGLQKKRDVLSSLRMLDIDYLQ